MSDKLIFYNISSKIDTWSGSIAKVKYLLDANKVKYETVWVPFSKIGDTLKERGVQPNPEPPYYTLPAITIGDETIFNSNKIVDYIIKNESSLFKKGILTQTKFKAYNDLVTPEFFNYFEKYVREDPKFNTFLHKIVIPNESFLLNDEDVSHFLNSAHLKKLDVEKIRNEPKDYEKIWNDAIYFLNHGLKESFDYPGLQRDKFLTGNFVYGDEFTWVDILFYTNFGHFEELVSGNVENTKPPKGGLVSSDWTKAWIKRIDDLVIGPKH